MLTLIPIERLSEYAAWFPGPQLEMVLGSIAAGNTEAQLWAQGEPQDGGAGLLWDQGNNVFYLAGTDTAETAEALERCLAGPVRDQALRGRYTRFSARAAEPALEQHLPELFRRATLHPGRKRFYRFPNTTQPEVPAPTVEGVDFVPIDSALLARENLQNLETVRAEIRWMWPSEARFRDHGFGIAALAVGQLICWCTAEYVGPRSCGIGIETVPPYEGRGVATATAARFVTACLGRGVRPHWECASGNAASNRVAEKLGFALVVETAVWVGTFLEEEPE